MSPYKQALPQVQLTNNTGFIMHSGLEALLLARQRSKEILRAEKSHSKLDNGRDILVAKHFGNHFAATLYNKTDCANDNGYPDIIAAAPIKKALNPH